ncbi:MAG: glycosyltransferase [Minisyncoccia bacterium]
MASDYRGASGIDKELADQTAQDLNKVLEKGVLPEEDFVILDEKLRSSIPSEKLETVVEEEEVALPPSLMASAARTESKILDTESIRFRTRLLIFSKDLSFRQEGSESANRIADLRTQFLEIHIVLLSLKGMGEEIPAQRLYDNVWLYTTNSSSWWKQSYDAYILAREQLMFGGGFRADIIIAEDLFESGLAGWFLSKKCERPFQIHISEDFFDTEFVESQDHPVLYEWSTEYLLKHVTSVRTKTELQRKEVILKNEALESVTEVLPKYYNLAVWKDFVPTTDLRKKYPQFNFIMLHISCMQTSSHAMEVLLAASKILRRYASIGLVMVGSGPLRALLEKTAITLEVEKQVEFEPMPAEVLSHMKTANVFIHLSENTEEDDLLLEAAVAKIPIVANISGLGGKLFVDGESAALCDIQSSTCIAEGINRYLSRNQDRSSFALNASDIVFERIEQDYTGYVESYAQSIERSVVSAS